MLPPAQLAVVVVVGVVVVCVVKGVAVGLLLVACLVGPGTDNRTSVLLFFF